jgi:hypothetical protein
MTMPADPNPIFDLGNPTWVQAVATPGETPAELMQFGNYMLPVIEGVVLPALGTRGIVQSNGVSLPGYLRQGGPTGYQWVILPPVDPIDALVDGVAGPQGWSDVPSRETWRGIAHALRGYGVSGGDLGYGLPALYGAARANLLKEYGVA